jgi:hypothetical protein
MMAEKIGQYLIDDDYRIHRVPGYEKPISLIDKENPRLPFYGVYPATIEMLPIPQRQEFEKRILTESDLQSQNKMYWVFWFNKNIENMADIIEIVFENRMDAQTLLELYIAFNTKVIESILEIANKNFKELTTID